MMCPSPAGVAQFGLGSQAGIHHGCAILAQFWTGAILTHYRRDCTYKAGLNGQTTGSET